MEDAKPGRQTPDALLPPTRTHAATTTPRAAGAVAPLGPFVAGRPRAASAPPIWMPPPDDPAMVGPVPPPPELDELAPIGFGTADFDESGAGHSTFDAPEDAAVLRLFGAADDENAADDEDYAGSAPGDDDATVDDGEAFPLDAFIVPPGRTLARADDEDAARQLDMVADRLADIAFELRAHGSAALQNRLHHGDRLDTVIAAVIAGYLAGLGES